MKLTRGTGALALVWCGVMLLPSASPARPPAEAAVAVALDHMVFHDGLHRAAFEVVGACVQTSEDVEVASGMCRGKSHRSQAQGTVRTAKLGFSAERRVEAVGADVPLVETDFAAADELFTSVRVNVERAGSLTVRMTGSPAPGVDPRPVTGSASSGGEVSDRSVVWRLPHASAGEHVFTARFRPNAEQGSAGTYVPEVDVELARETRALLEYDMGAVPAKEPALRASRLTLRQRVSPSYGPPQMTAEPFRSVWGGEQGPIHWTTQVAMQADGAYNASLSGPVQSAPSLGLLQDLAPAALAFVNSLMVAGTYPLVHGEAKARPRVRLVHADLGAGRRPVGFTASMETEPQATGRFPAIWDGDLMSFAVGAGAQAVRWNPEDKPADNAGRLRADAPGIGRGWQASWTGMAPGGEDNSADVIARAEGSDGAFHVVSGTIPFVVDGGDIDNRSGSEPVSGEPLVVDVPSDRTFASGVVVYLTIPETNFKLTWDFARSGQAIFSPSVRPGGYWLQSTADGYDRRWANPAYFSLSYLHEDTPPAAGKSLHHESVVVVPRGTVGRVQGVKASGRSSKARRLSPGTWRVGFSPAHGLTAARVVGGA